MIMFLKIFNFLTLPLLIESYKILVYQTAPGSSHIHFSGKLIDVLVDAGHTVDKLIIEWNPLITSNGTTKATRIKRFSLSKPSPWLSMPHMVHPFEDKFYHMADDEAHYYKKTLAEFCDGILSDNTVLEWIKEGEYDAALSSAYDACGFGLFYLAKIRSTFVYCASPIIDHWTMLLGIPNLASFVPNPLRNNKEGDKMTVFQKISALTDRTYQQQIALPSYHDVQTQVFRKHYGNSFPSVTDLSKRIQTIFVNSHPLLELQRPYSHKVRQIGGITMKKKENLLPEFEKILSSKKGTIVFSFGSIVKISEIPNSTLEMFFKVFSSLTDYNIIWKFDQEIPKMFVNFTNIHPFKWIQQVELLNDKRVKLFISHTGLNSLLEAAYSGVPVLSIPLFLDQHYNAQVLERRGVSLILDKHKITALMTSCAGFSIMDSKVTLLCTVPMLRIIVLLHHIPAKTISQPLDVMTPMVFLISKNSPRKLLLALGSDRCSADSKKVTMNTSSSKQNTAINLPEVPKTGQEHLSREINILNNRLRIIYEEERLHYNKITNPEEFKDRYVVASNMRKKRITTVLREIRASFKVELCFLVDVTGSMQRHINAVRDQIIGIVDRLTKYQEDQQSSVSKIHLAFVGYRDFGDTNQFEVLNFTDNPATFKEFCQSIVADGGGDGPEDIFGGLEEMLKLPWAEPQNGTKVVFHIADAPCHGKEFHSYNDNYPDGDPKKRTHTDLFKQIREKNIQYYFGKIKSDTDTMIEKFSEAYGEPIMDFDIKTVDTLTDSVVTAVKQSVSTSIAKSIATGGSQIRERNFTFVSEMPDWSAFQIIETTYVTCEYPKSVDDIIKDVPLIQKFRRKAKIQIAENPFAKGSERVAFYGRDLTYMRNDTEPNLVVLKEYKHLGRGMNSAFRYEMFNEVQTIASYLANGFVKSLEKHGKKLGEEIKMKFLKIKTVRINDSGANRRNMTLERYFSDCCFIRFSNNLGYQLTASEAEKKGVSMNFVELVMAFSHWTYQRTDGYLMVVDLEGVITHDRLTGKKLLLLTDPAIHCKDTTRFGHTNLLEQGMQRFFDKHKCNKFCQALKLPKDLKVSMNPDPAGFFPNIIERVITSYNRKYSFWFVVVPVILVMIFIFAELFVN